MEDESRKHHMPYELVFNIPARVEYERSMQNTVLASNIICIRSYIHNKKCVLYELVCILCMHIGVVKDYELVVFICILSGRGTGHSAAFAHFRHSLPREQLNPPPARREACGGRSVKPG